VGRYELFLKPSALREIEELPSRGKRRLVLERIEALAGEPRPRGCEKLSGREQYRVRQGCYRVVYSIDDAERIVRIVKIGRREDGSGLQPGVDLDDTASLLEVMDGGDAPE
jgi:mRNA interferase RelE/StbE